MCRVCDDWENDLLTPEEAFKRIKSEMVGADMKETRHLLELSDRILDVDMPFEELDPKLFDDFNENEE